jgi:nucleotide-binding universal stress UspA family protein
MSFTAVLALVLAVNLACAVLCALLASRTSRDAFGWVLVGAVLGPFAFIGLLGVQSNKRERPVMRRGASSLPSSGRVVRLPVDGSGPSLAALKDVIPNSAGVSEVILLNVLPIERASGLGAGVGMPRRELLDRAIDTATTEARHLFDRAGIPSDMVTRFGDPAAEILQEAIESSAGEVVMGRRGRGGVGKLLLGSVSERVVKTAAIPVTVVG